MKKKTPQLSSPRPIQHPEKLLRSQWTNKVKRFKRKQLRLLRLKMELQKKERKFNLQNSQARNKPQKRLLRPSHQFKKLLLLKRKFNNPVRKVQNNNNPKLPKKVSLSRMVNLLLPRRLNRNQVNKANNKLSQLRKLLNLHSKNLNLQF